jgi:C4-dicarboxylate-specific signal transduction histidine kinase
MSSLDIKDQIGRAVLESSDCLVTLVDSKNRILFANEAFRARFGLGAGATCHEAYKHRATPCEPCVAALSLADRGEHASAEQGVTADDKVICYQVRSVPLLDDSGEADRVVLIANDTTRIAELEQGIRQAERLANVGLSTAGLAHTIKNILAGLEGGVYIVDTGLEKGDAERLRSGWKMVQDYIEQVGSLVKSLLSYAKPRPPEHEQIEVEGLMEEVVRLYAAKAGASDIDLSWHVEQGTPRVVADRQSMQATLANLVTNAIDACTWDPDIDKKHAIAVEARSRPGGGVRIQVRDNGMGISRENQRKILVSSFTTKGMRGNGLGLLLSKQSVQDHGGTIDFDSRQGQGTTFTIDLPALPDGGQS